jgi:hypothetical protein
MWVRVVEVGMGCRGGYGLQRWVWVVEIGMEGQKEWDKTYLRSHFIRTKMNGFGY